MEDERNNNSDSSESIGSDSDIGSDSIEQQSDYSDINRFEDDIVTLRNFSFITANNNGTTFKMYRLV